MIRCRSEYHHVIAVIQYKNFNFMSGGDIKICWPQGGESPKILGSTALEQQI